MICWPPVMNKVYTMVGELKLQIHLKNVGLQLKPTEKVNVTVTRALQDLLGQPAAYITVL